MKTTEQQEGKRVPTSRPTIMMRIWPCLMLLRGGVRAFVPTHGSRNARAASPLEYVSDEDLPDALPPSTGDVRKRQPARRSFLHQLDRFLTELQGTDDHLRKVTSLMARSFFVDGK